MSYDNEKYIKNVIGTEAVFSHEKEKRQERVNELKEVYRKAKAFDEINKILDVYLGNVEDELNALNLIREKLEDMEDE